MESGAEMTRFGQDAPVGYATQDAKAGEIIIVYPSSQSFTIPGPCLAMPRPRARKMGTHIRIHNDPRLEVFTSKVALFARQAWGGSPPLEGPVGVDIVVFRRLVKASKVKTLAMKAGTLLPISRPDVDNQAKSILDGLTGIAYADDSQVVGLKASKRYDDGNGERVEVIIVDLTEPKRTKGGC